MIFPAQNSLNGGSIFLVHIFFYIKCVGTAGFLPLGGHFRLYMDYIKQHV